MAKYEILYQRLRMAILRGEYAPNDRLPSENAVAIKYGVSRITSKRALNDLAAADLVYRVRGGGTYVKPHKSTTQRQILLVLPFPKTTAFGDYQSGIRATLKDTTWELKLMANEDFLKLDMSTLAQSYAGIIYYPQNLATEMPVLMGLHAQRLPLVVLDKRPSALAVPSVVSDNVAGGSRACDHLQALGHQRIAFLPATPFWQTFTGTVSDRFMGYFNELTLNKVDPTLPLRWAQALQACSDAGQLQAYIHAQGITALIAENDVIALRAMHQLQELNPKIMQHLALIGFDNLPAAEKNKPALTTVVQDFANLGAKAVEALLDQINNPDHTFNEQTVVNIKLVVRASTTDVLL
ncbi:substrate-binding domain-containing protein [Lactiplantibacillus xiangfangensis]|uniref:Transcription regulator n=1 Tax=Lactiplantibacillus xiangfangensis TaxID=942150 RepID=A0A0R2MD60_9LACO|nr:LacI family DNA-binding transcriptional regulator [Lactiplantibacillus xiangfangensis]KRO11624.1 transcription regulator [Lactiplantibacillus xiangfangensis]